MKPDHLTRWASLTFLLAALFCAGSGLIGPPDGCAEESDPYPPAAGETGTQGLTVVLHNLRVKKCERLVLTFADYGDSRAAFLPHVEFFISEHERLGMAGEWYWSLVYGYANFGLRCYATAPGGCAGPMDVKHWPRITDPEANIRWHCAEMAGFYRRGVRGRDLCESVFYPKKPRDWDNDSDGRGRFERTDDAFRKCLSEGYRVGKLP